MGQALTLPFVIYYTMFLDMHVKEEEGVSDTITMFIRVNDL